MRNELIEILTHRTDNYALFISEDCKPTNAILKLLIATERINPQNLWKKRPTKGLQNLRAALERDHYGTCRTDNSSDFLGTLALNKVPELLSDIFRGCPRLSHCVMAH